MREKLTILNAFVHDVATGTWLGVLFLITLFHFETDGKEWEVAEELLPAVESKFMILSWVSLAIIAATGVVRMITFKVFGWTGDVAADRIRLLKIKHAVLGAAFGAGTIWQALIAYGH